MSGNRAHPPANGRPRPRSRRTAAAAAAILLALVSCSGEAIRDLRAEARNIAAALEGMAVDFEKMAAAPVLAGTEAATEFRRLAALARRQKERIAETSPSLLDSGPPIEDPGARKRIEEILDASAAVAASARAARDRVHETFWSVLRAATDASMLTRDIAQGLERLRAAGVSGPAVDDVSLRLRGLEDRKREGDRDLSLGLLRLVTGTPDPTMPHARGGKALRDVAAEAAALQQRSSRMVTDLQEITEALGPLEIWRRLLEGRFGSAEPGQRAPLDAYMAEFTGLEVEARRLRGLVGTPGADMRAELDPYKRSIAEMVERWLPKLREIKPPLLDS